MTSLCRRSAAIVSACFVLLLLAFAASTAQAQVAPIALPNTISTVAGGGVATTAGQPCATGSPYTATDAFGDGCPATMGVLGSSASANTGLVVDGQGNIFVGDFANNLIHEISARSGIITKVVGAGSTSGCPTLDGTNDGCPFVNAKSFNGLRGIGIDPWGNVFFTDASNNMVHMLCLATSPLCPNTTGNKLVGSMYRIAGCAASTASTGFADLGTTAGTAGDGLVASPFENLANDATAVGSTAGAGTCTTSLGGVDGTRGVAADKYGNVYIADSTNNRYRVIVGPPTFNSVANPLAAIIALNPTYSSITAASAYGHIYPLFGGFVTAPAKGAFCSGTSGPVTLDAITDGCPFYQTADGANSQGVAVDANGNVIFADGGNSALQVLYVGGTAMANVITVNNPTVTTPVVGTVYLLAGLASTSTSTTAAKGSAVKLDSNIFKLAFDISGNILIGDGNVLDFFDMTTGYIRKLAAPGTVCGAALNALGDGCTASTATWVAVNTGLGVGEDPQGNLYITDTEGATASSVLVRKISAAGLVTLPTNKSLTQSIVLHGAAGTTGITAALSSPSPGITVGSVTCPAANADTTRDCTVPVTYVPSSPGIRAASLVVTSTGSTGTVVLPLAGGSTGSALVNDSSSTSIAALGAAANGATGLTAKGIAIDGASNIYTMDTVANAFTEISNTGTVTVLPGTLPGAPKQLAVDGYGNVYAVGSGAASITKLTLTAATTYAASTISLIGNAVPTPAGIAVDVAGNIYVSDSANGTVTEIAANSAFQPNVTLVTGLGQAGQLALDGLGNLYVADIGAGKVFKINGSTGVQTTAATGVNPVGITADPAGDLYIQDGTAKTITEISASTVPVTTTVLNSGLTTPSGIAVDGNGVLYSADSNASTITQVQRNAVTIPLGTSTTTTQLGTVTNVGNLAATGLVQTLADTTVFSLAGGTTNGCVASNGAITTTTPVAIGQACTLQATLSTAGTGPATTTTTFNEATATQTTGSLTVTGTLTGSSIGTTTTVGNETPASPIFIASGTEVSFTVTVTPVSGTTAPTGTFSYTLDGGSPVTGFALTTSGSNAVGTIALSGITVGSHALIVTYSGGGGFGTSISTSTPFFVSQTTAYTTGWTLTSGSTTTESVSQAIGVNVLNASSGIPGGYVYTVTEMAPITGTPTIVDASTYLPIAAYILSATFTPTDSVDYGPTTLNGGTINVVQDVTTAPIGASQFVVAPSGGNFTTVQTAIAALATANPTTGGSIYIAPGTYTGFVNVNNPNVALRGLGGDPRNVILTNEFGAFSAPFLGSWGAGTQGTGNEGTTSDEGSATLLVVPTPTTSTFTPTNFYAENFTVNNTYDTDSTNSTTISEPTANGTCTVGQPANNNFTLFLAQTICGTQALAIFTSADQSVMNNIYTASLQDTVFSGGEIGFSGSACSGTCTTARQYWWRGKITGAIDYIFGDSAAVFDHTNIFTVFHGTSAGQGTETVEAQSKHKQTGATGDYLSGYVFNHATFTSQASGMTKLEFGRPYGAFSTTVLLNSFVDQVDPQGWIEFNAGSPTLPTSTYVEFNTSTLTTTNGSADPNGVIYTGTTGNTGTGVTGTRETTSLDPGWSFATNTLKTQITAAQAAQFYPDAFLGNTVVAPALQSGSSATWVATDALATGVNSFVPTAAPASIAFGASITILMRPATAGGGILPTGTYTLTDSFNSAPGVTIASGTLDATGEAFLTTTTLASGVHSLTWAYGGDANFAGSTTVTPEVITVAAQIKVNSTTTLSVNNATTSTYGQAITGTATVTPVSGTVPPTGTVTLLVNGVSAGNCTLIAGTGSSSCIFSLTGIQAGTYSLTNGLTASYGGDAGDNASASAAMTITVNPGTATLGTVVVNPTSDPLGTNSSVALSVSLTYPGVLAPSGAVTFVMNTVPYTATCSGSSPQTCTATVPAGTIAALAANTYPVTVSLAADTNYNAIAVNVANNGTFTIGKTTPTLGAVSFAPAVSEPFGTSQAITLGTALTYTGTSAPTGAVAFTLNSVSYPATCAGSSSPQACTAIVPAATIAALPFGAYPVTTAFAGDTNYNAIAAAISGSFVISKATPTLGTVTFSPASSEPFGTNQAITLSDTLTYNGSVAPSGGVTFILNAVSYPATCTTGGSPRTCTAIVPGTTIAALPATGYVVSAALATDTNYFAANGTASVFTINLATQTITFGPLTPVTYGVAPITLSASGGGSPNPVTFTITGGTGSGILSGPNNHTLTVNGAGTIIITANQAGNANFSAATAVPQTLTVNKATLTFGTMSFSPAAIEPLNTSQAITITDTLSFPGGATPLGVVNFTLNSVTYPATCTGSSPQTCTATVPAATIAALAINPYTVTVSDAGDTNYLTATGTSGTFTIGTVAPAVSTVSAISIPFGSTTSVTVIATESGSAGAPTGGVVTFGKAGAATGSFSPTTCTLTTFGSCFTTYTPTGVLPAGTYTNDITAGFAAVGGYLAANGTSTLTVTPDATAVALTQTAPASIGSVGTAVSTTFTATVTDATLGTAGTPTGSVQFLDGSTSLGTSTLTSGVATLTTTFTATGTHSISAVYQGDGNFTGATGTFSESVVTPGFTAVANPSSLTIHRGQTGVTILTFTPVGGYQGTLNLACPGLPAGVTCVFTPSTITFSGDNSVQTSELQVVTSNGNVMGGTSSGLLWLPAGMLACLVAMRRRKLVRGLRPLLMIVIAALAMTAMTGCGTASAPAAPLGSSSVTVTAATTAGGTGSPAISLTINIIP